VRKVLWTADLIGIDYDRGDWDCRSATPMCRNSGAQPQRHGAGDRRRGYVLWESSAVIDIWANA
jgi:hypothetical protein